MRIVVCHSAHERCGIRQYGQQLDRSLAAIPGLELEACDYSNLGSAMETSRAGDVFLFHYEPQLPGDWTLFARRLATLRASGCKTAFVCHWYSEWVPHEYGQLVDLFIRHRYYDGRSFGRRIVEIPLACPTYVPKTSRAELRARFGMPAPGEGLVLTTVGFLTKWKRMPESIDRLLAELSDLPRAVVHVQAPWPFDVEGSGAAEEDTQLRSLVARYEGRLHFSTDFVPEEELLDRVHASDLGFVFHGRDTDSVSAATKQFVSARTPVVVTDSTHASDLQQGVRRVGGFDPGTFAKEVVRIARDVEEHQRLSDGIRREYERINMDAVAKRYEEELRKL
jgi:glycosyltransferase involved in cell wall biosynthesis